MGEYVLIFGIAILIGLIAYGSYVQARKRREALRAVADRLGLSFEPAKDHTLHRLSLIHI